jgi:energy-coupling factor transporter transmembrane protein EcfT
MSPLTTWHYLLIAILGLLFIIGVILSMQTKSKFSVLATVTLVLGFIAFFSWSAINENVYLVEVSNLDQERYYQSEQILIKGTVRNVGKFPVANVVAVVRLSNSTGGGAGNKDGIFTQPTVFAEIFEGDNPNFVRQNVIEEHPIADSLSPGKSKPFKIMMDYPPHFKNSSYEVTAKASY